MTGAPLSLHHVATINSPLSVSLKRKTKKDRKFILNLNNYRNTHHHILNPAKILYKELVQNQIYVLPEMSKVKVRYTLFPRTRQTMDVPNVCAIHDKFFMDALVEAGRLPDDNYHHYLESSYRFGSIDKTNPRVEIEIYELK